MAILENAGTNDNLEQSSTFDNQVVTNGSSQEFERISRFIKFDLEMVKAQDLLLHMDKFGNLPRGRLHTIHIAQGDHHISLELSAKGLIIDVVNQHADKTDIGYARPFTSSFAPLFSSVTTEQIKTIVRNKLTDCKPEDRQISNTHARYEGHLESFLRTFPLLTSYLPTRDWY